MKSLNLGIFKSWNLGSQKDETAQVIEKAKTIIRQLQVTTERLSKNDIAAWRLAHQQALNVDNPRRMALYNIYDFTTDIDTHLTGVKNRTKMGIIQRKFKMVDEAGKENAELTKMLKAPWFFQFMSHALDADYYGHSLIQFGNVVCRNGKSWFEDVELVPRRHVVPEFGVLLRDPSDNPAAGIPYRTGTLANWCIEAGAKYDLGLFLKVTPHVISKKHVQIFWDNFAERFGIPLIYTSTDARSDADRVKIENMLSQMGNSSWAYFPQGTVLNLLETSKGDAFQVFDRRIVRANKEISIGLAGQTMAFEDGASLSQAEVHDAGFEEIKDGMALNLEFLINFKLAPLMIAHGFPIQGYSFEWDNAREYTPDEMSRIEETILRNYNVDPEYFIERYNIPITGEREPGAAADLSFLSEEERSFFA
jgi:hypothetical protein